MLMASKMVDGQRHSPSTLIIWIGDRNKFCNHYGCGPYCVSCVSEDKLFICKRQASCFISMNKAFNGHIMIMNGLFLFYSR